MTKVDKIFKWVSIILLSLLISSFLVINLIEIARLRFLVPFAVILALMNAFAFPIGNLILIATFFIKLFSKNKTKNDKIQIILNLISIIICSIAIFSIQILHYLVQR